MALTRLLRHLLLLLPLVALVSCKMFITAFPDYLTLVSAQRSLQQEISSAEAHSYTLSSVAAPSGDLVFLATSQAVSGTALYVMDGALNVLQRFTSADISAFSGRTPPVGARGFLDSAGNVIILGIRGTPTAAGLTAMAALGESPAAGDFGFAQGAQNVASFQMPNSTQVAYYIYSPWGAGAYRGNFDIEPTGTLNFNLVGAWSDPARADVVLVFEETSSDTDLYLLLSRSDVISGLAWPFTDFYPSFTTASFPRDLVGYTQNGFIAMEWGNNGSYNRFVRFDMSGASLPDSMEYRGSTDMQIATRFDGGWYYTWDRRNLQLRRINAWWTN
jgi:hypothetical protein